MVEEEQSENKKIRATVNTRKKRVSSASSDVGLRRKGNKKRPAGHMVKKGSRAVLMNCHQELTKALASEAPSTTFSESSTTTAPCISPARTETGSTPFTEGEDILVHLEDGLIYLGVVVEMEEEQGQCLVRFGDCTERWSSFNELQRLGEISDGKSTPLSTPTSPELGIEKEAITRERQFSCFQCEYLCSSSAILKSHLTRVHTRGEDEDRKLYSCTQCDYSGARSEDLKRHVRIHTGQKPYSCTHCDYSSAEHSNLKTHIRTHTGEKPYSCTQCDYSISQDLKRHARM